MQQKISKILIKINKKLNTHEVWAENKKEINERQKRLAKNN